jgi:hypothetical protein
MLEVRAIVELDHTLRPSAGAMGGESREHCEFLRRCGTGAKKPNDTALVAAPCADNRRAAR